MNLIQDRPQPPLLDLQNVRVMRGRNVVLDELCLRVQVDEHVAVLGPNGCGKSTLIKTITRECYPVVREGSSMSILGQKSWNVFELRSLLGIVSNDLMSSCTGDASGLDVVLSGFFSSTRIFPNHSFDSEQKKLAEAALAQLGVSHLAERAVEENRAGAGPQTARSPVRRAVQFAGHSGAARPAGNHAGPGAVGNRNYSGDA
jgi:iron complex transport system ATP-binding protein